MWLFVFGTVTTLILSIPITIALYTLVLACLTRSRSKTLLYVGRVKHTRLVPVVHSFSYPLFWCAIELQQDDDDEWNERLWPLSTVMQFRQEDHYKHMEESGSGSLLERTFQLCKTKTNGKFQPTPSTHSVMLLTHLRYYGYCFNPVSFYFVFNSEKNNQLEAVVTEVSNTPWNEMHVYVLHPDSVDVLSSSFKDKSWNYQFHKAFHVSPFMDMDHVYDWTFDFMEDDLDIYAKMKKLEGLQFTASVTLSKCEVTPLQMALQLVKFPVYCALIQVWIHYEAFWLFAKGVVYQPHPEGSTTGASRAIAAIMTPLFALKDKLCSKQKES